VVGAENALGNTGTADSTAAKEGVTWGGVRDITGAWEGAEDAVKRMRDMRGPNCSGVLCSLTDW
jgi:hypothetical protein